MFNHYQKQISKLLLLTFVISLLPTYSIVYAKEKIALAPVTNGTDLPFYVDSFNQEQPTNTTQIDTNTSSGTSYSKKEGRSSDGSNTNTTGRSSDSSRTYKTRPKTTIFTRIEDNENITGEFKIWAEEINTLDEALFSLGNDEILKADTSIETNNLITENQIIVEKISEKYSKLMKGKNGTTKNNRTNLNDLAYAAELLIHYQRQDQRLNQLLGFNQAFECLLIKAELEVEVDGEMLSTQDFVSRSEGITNCTPGPNIKSSGSTTTSDSTDPLTKENNSSDNGTLQDQTIVKYLPHQNLFENIINSTKVLAISFINYFAKTDKVLAYSNAQEALNDLPQATKDSVNEISNNIQFGSDDEKNQFTQQVNDIANTPSGNPVDAKQDSLPPPLEFHDPNEISILLPRTIEDFQTNEKNGNSVDERIYFLLNHIYRTLEKEGEEYDSYVNDQVIQDATTPGLVKANCGALESNPNSCAKPFTNICGMSSAYYFLFQVATGNIDNLGVPYKDRAHLKIWLGLNAPEYTDENDKDDEDGQGIPNPHRYFQAIDITEIGMYNESVDCTLCKGLPSCKMFTTIMNAYSAAADAAASAAGDAASGAVDTSLTDIPAMGYNNLIPEIMPTAHAQSINPLSLAQGIYTDALFCLSLCNITFGAVCIPCCPRILDTGSPLTVPVKVKWQNENYGSVLTDLAGTALDEILPIDPENGFSIQGMLKGLAQGAMEQLFNSSFKNFDVAKLAQGGFETFMSEMGNQWLDEKVFGKMGLPEGFASGIDFTNPNPESLVSGMLGGYLDQELDLGVGSFTPIIAAMMSGDFKDAALASLNLTPNLNLPPKLQEAMNIAIQNGDNPKAMGLAFANIGLNELNSNILGWPEGILDIDSFSGEGFIGIANRLGQHGISQIQGLPTDFVFDINNPKNTAMSLTGSLLSDVTDNQRINNAINTALSQGENFSINSAMQLLETEDLAQVFDIDLEDAQIVRDHLDNMGDTSFSTIRGELLNKIDFDTAALKNTNFTPETLQLLFDYGLNPAYSDNTSNIGSLMLSAVSNSIKLDKIGIDLNKTDIEKLAFIQDYIQIANNTVSNSSQTSTYGYNPLLINPELQTIQNEFASRFGPGESIYQYHDRIVSSIDQASQDPNSATSKAINDAKYLTSPIKIKFNQRIKKDELTNYDYIDIVNSNPQDPTNNKTFNGVLRSLEVDLNSLEIITKQEFEQKGSIDPNNFNSTSESTYLGTSTPNSFANPFINSEEYYEPNIEYYAYPKIDMAEIILPGIREDYEYQNQTGIFKLLDTSTNILSYAQKNPIQINLFNTNSTLNNIIPIDPQNSFSSEANSTTLNLILSQDPFKNAFLDKQQVTYKQPDNSNTVFDKNTFRGGSDYIYDTLKNTGKNPAQTQEDFSNIGTMVISSAMTGIDIATLFDKDLNTTELEDKLEQITNAMGIVKSWQTGDIDSGIQSSISFLKDNGIFDNISTDSSWNIGEDGSISIEGVDLLGMYNNISSGNYQQALQDIPAIQNKFSELENALGANPFDLIDLAQNFDPQKATDTILDIMSNKITSETGLEKLAVVQELTSTLGVPPDPKNIPNLLQSKYFQENVLGDIDPELLGDISGIYGLIASGDITPQKAISTIMTANFFQNAIGKETFGEFMGDYGGIVNAALTGDPQSIASSIMSSPKIADKLNSFFADQGISDYFDVAGLQSLINGDIEGFIKDTSMKYLEKELLSKLDGAIGGLIGSSVLGILNGEFPYEALTQFASEYLIENFLGSGDELLEAFGSGFTDGLTLDPASIGADAINGIIDSVLSGAISGFVFTKCKKKIAQDNIIHLTDIILSYDTSPFNHRYYNIETDENGNITSQGYTQEQAFFPLQIFSDFNDSIFGKLIDKASEKFDNIWYKNRSDKLNLFQKKCSERENPYMKDCEEAIHIGF